MSAGAPPKRSIERPAIGAPTAPASAETEKAAESTPRDQPVSRWIGSISTPKA